MHARISYVSVDDHVVETPSVWTDRVAAGFGDRVPHLRRNADGSDSWVIDGKVIPLEEASVGAVMVDRARGPRCWEEVPRAAWDPVERLRAMDADGVSASVLYPMVAGLSGERFASMTDTALEIACARAYNDWLIDVWAAASTRFIPQCIVPLGDIAAGVEEIRRAVGRGHRGVVLPGNPTLVRGALAHVNEPDYDPIWAVCAELGVPVCFHAGATPGTQMPPYKDYAPDIVAALAAMTRPVSSTFILANMFFSGILVRHPDLRVIFAETTLAWGAYTLESADHQFERQRYDMAGWDIIPSAQFHRQCFLTGWYDRSGIETRHVIGTENMLWSSNFPQATSTWPEASATIERCFAGVDARERHAILVGNASKLYKIPA